MAAATSRTAKTAVRTGVALQTPMSSPATAMLAVADPHTTGKTLPDATPWASVCSSSSKLGVSPSR